MEKRRNFTPEEKAKIVIEVLDKDNKKLSISRQANLLSINRTSLYYRHALLSNEELQVKHLIDEIYTAHPEFGYRRMTNILNRDYHLGINQKRTRKNSIWKNTRMGIICER
jgi:putative transposase